ncbi:hypothetical protein DRH27_01285 [Candidatus Falkowbacteria bacterium]|nr:MAG: hypothetical protein DRH27_01285 [Candidatus Falkowbacteria bacterium]
MGCCGKTKNIVKGLSGVAIEKLTRLKIASYEFTNDRIRTCHKCDEQTWLTKIEYLTWLFDNGIKILRNWSQLETLPKLSKKEQRKNCGLYCRICKCFIPGKARIDNEKCPLDKWEGV